MSNWMKGAVKPSHKGLFRKKAERAGMSTAAYARKEAAAPGKLGREARLAETFAKFRPKKKTGLADHLTSMRAAGKFGKAKRRAA
jgi:hypothetical protein